MTTDVVELFRKASDLSENDRATLAGLLIESLESERDDGVEPAWIEEVERRIAELDSGAVEAIPWEEVKARLSSRLNDSKG